MSIIVSVDREGSHRTVSGEIIRSGVEEDFVIKVDERQFNRQPRHKVRLTLTSLPGLRDSTVNLVPE